MYDNLKISVIPGSKNEKLSLASEVD